MKCSYERSLVGRLVFDPPVVKRVDISASSNQAVQRLKRASSKASVGV